MSPVVSVIVPTRNRSELVPRCLNAIAAQSFDDFEVLLIDDGSSEEHRAANRSLVELLGGRFHYDTTFGPDHPGTGPSAARNRGLKRAQGEFIAFCDDDDWWSSTDHLAVAIEVLQRHSIDLYFSDMVGFRDGRIAIASWFPDREWLKVGRRFLDIPPVFEVSLRNLLRTMLGHCPHLNACLMRTSCVREAGEFWEASRYWEDTNFLARVIDRCQKFAFRADTPVTMDVSARPRAFLDRSEMDRASQLLASILHLQLSCTSREVLRWARQFEVWHLRNAAQQAAKRGDVALAGMLAARAVSLRPSAKTVWTFITTAAGRAI